MLFWIFAKLGPPCKEKKIYILYVLEVLNIQMNEIYI